MLEAIVLAYLAFFPNEMGSLDWLQAQLAQAEVLNDRKNFRGHVTGSAVVLSPDRTHVLMIHHKILDKWLQPGGHMDLDEVDPRATAVREATEETGVAIAEQITVGGDPILPLLISTHAIAANAHKQEDAHYHHDFKYLFVAKSERLEPALKEVLAAAWVAFDDPRIIHISESIEKMRQLKIV